jgi:predicted transcriptional regulator
MEFNEVHIGKEIRKKLNEKNLSAAWLAEKIHYSTRSVYRFLSKPNLRVNLITEISNALQYNFFKLYLRDD